MHIITQGHHAHYHLASLQWCRNFLWHTNQSSSKILSGLTTPSPPPTTTMMCHCPQVCTSPPSVLNTDDHGSPSVDDVDHHYPNDDIDHHHHQWCVLTIRYVTPPCTTYTNKGLWQPQHWWVCLCTNRLVGGLLLIWGFADVFHCFYSHFRVNSSALSMHVCIRMVARSNR